MVSHMPNAWQTRDADIRRRGGDASGVLIETQQPVPIAMHDFERRIEIGVTRR